MVKEKKWCECSGKGVAYNRICKKVLFKVASTVNEFVECVAGGAGYLS